MVLGLMRYSHGVLANALRIARCTDGSRRVLGWNEGATVEMGTDARVQRTQACGAQVDAERSMERAK